ncbi:hypothetical protein C8J56DRAFT_769756 [Mycena floridula]|nr:hypothetical protein C8J56DRAFT_769756 [Mycena floridula]
MVYSLIQQCFPLADATPLLSVSFEDAQHGLAAKTLQNRAKYMIQLMWLMLEWSGGLDALVEYAEIDEPGKMTTEAEEAIIVFYVQSFFDYFGRPPTIPHRLDALRIIPGHVASS